MNTLSLKIKYRPLRIGWCLNSGDAEGLRKALSLSHALWGGRYNPLIPIEWKEAPQLVRLFRVDLLIPASNDKAVVQFMKEFPYLHRPFFHPEIFHKDTSNKVYPQVLDLYHPIRRLYEDHFKNNPKPDFKATLFHWEKDDPLREVFLATFGDFPSAEDTGNDYCHLIEKYLAAEKINLTVNEAVHPDSFNKVTPNRICCADLQPHYSVVNYWNTPGFYFGSASEFDDIVHYWNLRAADIELLFYDPSLASRLNAIREDYLAMLQKQPKRQSGFDAHATIWYKGNLDKVDLSEFGKDVLRCSVGFGTWNNLNVKAPLMQFGEKSVLATVGSSAGKTSLSFSLPEKPCLNDGRLLQQHLVASISSGVGLYGNEAETITTPYIAELNEFYGRNFYFDWNKARVEPEGIGIIIKAWQEDLTLSALKITSLVAKIFEVSGINARTSRPGLIATRLIQQLEGLQGCRVFKISGVRSLIEKYKPDQSFTKSGAIQIIREVDRGSGIPKFLTYEDLFIESRPWKRKLKPDDALTYLVKHRVFRAGLKLRCPSCLLNFWLSLDDVKTKSECEYCGDEFDITPQLRDRDWHYRRSGLFGKENHQEGAIPVLLTLQLLQTVFSPYEMLYTTAMELEPESAPIQKCETDFVILTHKNINHEVEIAIGECKNRDEITEDDVMKLKSVAESLEQKGVRVFVIFSKLSEFSQEELQRCIQVNSKYRRRLILFTSRELEPYHLYERTAKEYAIDRYAVSFEQMVNITQQVFFKDDSRNANGVAH